MAIPAPQPRPRGYVIKIRGKHTVRMFNPKSANEWRKAVEIAAMLHVPREPLNTAIGMNILFVLPRPKSHYRTGKYAGELRKGAPRYPISTPDLDNLEKSTLDAITNSGLWRDDSLVVKKATAKVYCEKGAECGAEITLWLVEDIHGS